MSARMCGVSNTKRVDHTKASPLILKLTHFQSHFITFQRLTNAEVFFHVYRYTQNAHPYDTFDMHRHKQEPFIFITR